MCYPLYLSLLPTCSSFYAAILFLPATLFPRWMPYSDSRMLKEIQTTNCITCGRQVEYQEVLTDFEGKQGRWLAKCQQTNPFTSITCDFWDWHPGHPAMRLTPANLASTSQAAPPTNTVTCRATGCRSKRIRKGCDKSMCKAHCMEAVGDCSQAAHKVVRPRQAFLSNNASPPPPISLQTTSTQVLPLPPHAASSLPPDTIPVTAARSEQFALDPSLLGPQIQLSVPPLPLATKYAGPAFSSHMSDIFTEQMAEAQRQWERKSQKDALQIQSKERAKNTVFVYPFLNDDIEPKPFEVQEGFVWPFFVLNEAVLRQAGLSLSPDNTFELFRQSLGHWTTVKIGHVIDIAASPRVFTKSISVRNCKDLSKLMSPPVSTSPNIRTNLAGERAYVRRKMIEREVSQAPAPFEKNRRDSSRERNSSPLTPNKRPRLQLQRSSTRKLKTGLKSWPADFHAVDIANFLQEIENSDHKNKTQVIFEQRFAVPFKSSTFYDHQDRWKRAALDTKDTFISAGHAEAGLWKYFMAANPARDAALKAARRRQARSVAEKPSLGGHQVVDLSSSDEGSGSE